MRTITLELIYEIWKLHHESRSCYGFPYAWLVFFLISWRVRGSALLPRMTTVDQHALIRVVGLGCREVELLAGSQNLNIPQLSSILEVPDSGATSSIIKYY